MTEINIGKFIINENVIEQHIITLLKDYTVHISSRTFPNFIEINTNYFWINIDKHNTFSKVIYSFTFLYDIDHLLGQNTHSDFKLYEVYDSIIEKIILKLFAI